MQSKRKRYRIAVSKNSPAAYRRKEIIGNAISQAQGAAKAGFFLEAITLTESLIADRLESHLSYLSQKAGGFEPLGTLITALEKQPKLNASYKELLLKDIKPWTKKRNYALHEMAKLSETGIESFAEKYAAAKQIFIEGEAIRKKLFKLDKQEKRNIQNDELKTQ